MDSVADELRRDLRERGRALPIGERVDRALAMGALALQVFAEAQALDIGAARRELQRRRQASRLQSACMDGLLR